MAGGEVHVVEQKDMSLGAAVAFVGVLAIATHGIWWAITGPVVEKTEVQERPQVESIERKTYYSKDPVKNGEGKETPVTKVEAPAVVSEAPKAAPQEEPSVADQPVANVEPEKKAVLEYLTEARELPGGKVTLHSFVANSQEASWNPDWSEVYGASFSLDMANDAQVSDVQGYFVINGKELKGEEKLLAITDFKGQPRVNLQQKANGEKVEKAALVLEGLSYSSKDQASYEIDWLRMRRFPTVGDGLTMVSTEVAESNTVLNGAFKLSHVSYAQGSITFKASLPNLQNLELEDLKIYNQQGMETVPEQILFDSKKGELTLVLGRKLFTDESEKILVDFNGVKAKYQWNSTFNLLP